MKKRSIVKWFNDISIKRKLYFTVGIMALLIFSELMTLLFAVNTLSSVRAYVGGEGLYSKAQKDAVYHLLKYGRMHYEHDYLSFLTFMKVPLGDHKSRVELFKKNPDLEVVRKGFLEGRNHPDDIDGMIKLFRRFHNISYLNKAIGLWNEADSISTALIPIGNEIHTEIISIFPSSERLDALLSEIDSINLKLTTLEDNFSYTLGEGSRWMEDLIFKILLIIALTVEFSGLLLTIFISRGISKGIDEIIDASESVAKGNFKNKAEVFSKDEIGQLAGSFNQMTTELEKKINELELAEDKIKASNLQLGEAQRLAHIGSWEWDVRNNFITWSDELYRIFNLSPDQFKPSYENYLANILHGEREHVNNIIQRAYADHQPFDFYHRILLKDGSTRIISSHGKVLVEDGIPVKMTGTAQDVTETKQAVALKESEERYRTLAETASDAIVTIDQDGNIQFVNSATAKLFGYLQEEMIGNNLSKLIADSLADNDKKELKNYLETGVKNFLWKADELKGLNKNGREFPIEISFNQFNRNEKKYFTGIIRDITERKKTEDQLMEAKEKAEQMSQARQEFLSVMSHEMRTPLNAVVGITHLLMEDKMTPEQEENINILYFSSQNLLALINNILDFSKIESGKIQLETIDFNLNKLIKRLMDSFRHNAQEKQVKLTLHTEIDLPERLIGDPVRLTQVFTNLIHNAIKFTEQGEVCLSVKTLSSDSDNITLQFEISDTGIGIEEDRLNEIFDSYTQAKPSITRQFGGTGLGLTICKKLINMMGGDIQVKSEMNKGSVFSFHLMFPISKNEEQKPSQHRHEKDFNLDGVKILLVEDNITNRALAKKFITRWGATVDTAENGLVAIKKVNEAPYDLVLMDLQMPVMDGYSANRAIRNLGFSSEKLPVIALSAYLLDEVKTKVRSSGMNDFLSKPIDPYELYRKIVKNIKRKMRNENDSFLMVADEQDVLNINQLIESFDNNFKNEFLKLIEKEFNIFVSDIRVNARERNSEQVRQLIHKIIPSVKRFKNKELLQHLDELKKLMFIHADDAIIEKNLEQINNECKNIFHELNELKEKYLKG